MAELDKVKSQVDNLRENYKALITLTLMLVGATGSMVFMAVDKQRGIFYVLATLSMALSFLVLWLLKRTWKDLSNKTEELHHV